MSQILKYGGLETKGLVKKSEPGMPLISIITVVFNGEKYLEETIKSVINQTYKNIQYIIVDGASKDSTIDIIEKYNDKIDYWLSERDSGIADAFNKGLRFAKGELISFINSDDWYEPDAVQTIVNHYSEKYHIYCGILNLFDKNNNFIKYRRSRIHLIKFGMYIMHPTLFVHKRIFEEVGGFDTSFKIAMDFDFILRVRKLTDYSFKNTDTVLANMRMIGVSSDLATVKEEELIVKERYLKPLEFLISKNSNFVVQVLYYLKIIIKSIIQRKRIDKDF